jgi:hypothetical protein
MRQLIITTFFLAMSLTIVSGQNIFQKDFGTVDYEEIYGLDLTNDGGYILGGYSGFGTFAYFIKLDANGDTTWTRRISAAGFDLLYSIEQTDDHGYIAGGRSAYFGPAAMNMILIKLDSNGTHEWTRAIGEYEDETVNCIKQTLDGGFIVAGNTYSFTPGLNDFYIVKTDSLGNIIWTKSIGGAQNDNAYSVTLTTDSGYVAVGLTGSVGAGDLDVLAVKLDNNGNIVWMKTYGGTGDDRANSIQETDDAGFIISGVTSSFGAGMYDFNLIKIDSSGNLSWSKTYGGANDDWSYHVEQTNDDGYILTGYAGSFGNGANDYYLVKTNSVGDTLWTKTFGGAMADNGHVVKQTPDGGYAIIGQSQSFAFGSYDYYFVKTDGSGKGICNQTNPNTIVTSPAQTVTNPVLTLNAFGSSIATVPTVTHGTAINSLCTNVGIQTFDNSKTEILLYPNPFYSSATMKFENTGNENYTLTIYNTYGQIVRTIKNIVTNNIQIEKQNLTTGLYYFKLSKEEKIIGTGKLNIE